MAKKQKLTLTVDSGVVKSARDMGINISEITEKILKGFTFEPEKGDQDALYQKYQEFFETMLPLLKKYQTSVIVGKEFMEFGEIEICLIQDGTFWYPEREYEEKEIKKIKLYNFLNPKDILLNFMQAIAKSQESNKQKLVEIEMARRIILAIANTKSTTPSIIGKTYPFSSKNKTRKKKGR